MNLHVSFLDGYVDSGARVADMERILWDVDYIEGYRQRITDESEWAAEVWAPDTSEAPSVDAAWFDADWQSIAADTLCDLAPMSPTLEECTMAAMWYDNEPGYRSSWHTY